MILNIAYDVICYVRYKSITSYTISYTTSFTISLSLFLCCMWTGSVRAPSSAGGQPDDIYIAWNTDDERDYLDLEYSPPSPMAHYPGSRDPLARFMADLPNLDDFDKLALNDALQGLPVPVSCPVPPGISLQDQGTIYIYIVSKIIYNVHTRILTGLMYRILTETMKKCKQLWKQHDANIWTPRVG